MKNNTAEKLSTARTYMVAAADADLTAAVAQWDVAQNVFEAAKALNASTFNMTKDDWNSLKLLSKETGMNGGKGYAVSYLKELREVWFLFGGRAEDRAEFSVSDIRAARTALRGAKNATVGGYTHTGAVNAEAIVNWLRAVEQDGKSASTVVRDNAARREAVRSITPAEAARVLAESMKDPAKADEVEKALGGVKELDKAIQHVAEAKAKGRTYDEVGDLDALAEGANTRQEAAEITAEERAAKINGEVQRLAVDITVKVNSMLTAITAAKQAGVLDADTVAMVVETLENGAVVLQAEAAI